MPSQVNAFLRKTELKKAPSSSIYIEFLDSMILYCVHERKMNVHVADDFGNLL